MELTDYHAKYFAHEITRRFSVADSEKLAGALLDAQVDLNPHQVEAALFAFKSPLSKGAVLADEVGLGKTIEAGLLLAQNWAEGKRRILIVVPANIRKQWMLEMEDKFFLPACILETKTYNQLVKSGVKRPFEQDSLVICSYQFAATNNLELMKTHWNLVVIDEAHRLRNVYKPDNKMGRALQMAFRNIPKVLLTATPLQNSLMELYGLVSLIDDFAFGGVKSFRRQFAKLTSQSNFDDLKERLKPICQRTLRRQVVEYISYTNRIPITQAFVPSDEEQTLYDLVSDYLRRPSLKALPASQRSLMTLVMRKLLASSTYAIAGALDTLAKKLIGQIRKDQSVKEQLAEKLGEDYEGLDEQAEEWPDDDLPSDVLSEDEVQTIQQEIDELQAFRDLAQSITENAKGLALLNALKAGFAKARELGAKEKTIIFTESRRTQDYLVQLLSQNGYDGKFMLFNGTNTDTQSRKIYQAWLEANKDSDRVSGSKTGDLRSALVDHFKDQSQIMIATEAAAEGINLQFCSMVVNYDLPWNPQRIEQRIGRCHRYGQKYDVVVINFLNKKNAADQRVFQLLDEKFKLFSGVFGASDEVLGAIESGVDFEKRIVSIYQNCRTTEEIEAEFAKLRQEMDEQITLTMQDTRRKLLENFDAEVHDRLRINMEESQHYLNKYEQILWNLTQYELRDYARFDMGELNFYLHAMPKDCPEVPSGPYHLGREFGNAHRYRLGHPLAQYIIGQAKQRPLEGAEIQFQYSDWGPRASIVEPLRGKSGIMTVQKLAISGGDDQDHIILEGKVNNGTSLTPEQIRRLFDLPGLVTKIEEVRLSPEMQAGIKNQKDEILNRLEEQKANWFDQEIQKLDHWAEDTRQSLKADLKEYDEQIAGLKKEARSARNLPEKLEFQKQIRSLDKKRDEAWRQYDESAKEVERQKDALLDEVEARLQQQTSEETLFTLRWQVA